MAKKRSKRYRELVAKVDRGREYPVREAIETLKQVASAKFDESLELACRLGVDPRKAEENVRGTVTLPHGTGKVPRVACFAKGEAAVEAEQAGADVVGAEDLIERIEGGWEEFDILVAHVDMMRAVGRLGRKLGPRMPNKKSGTATEDVGQAIREIKAGKVEYRVDRQSNLNCLLGKVSFDTDKLLANFSTLYGAIWDAKPAGLKGTYVRRLYLATTMGPGLKIDLQDARQVAGR